MPVRALAALDLYDPTATTLRAGASALAGVFSRVVVGAKLGDPETLTLDGIANVFRPVQGLFGERCVVRATWSSGPRTWWRVTTTTTRYGATNGHTVECDPLWLDLDASVVAYQLPGSTYVDVGVTLAGTVADVLARLFMGDLAPPVAACRFVVGTIDPAIAARRVFVVLNNESHLGALAKVLAGAEAETEFVASVATGGATACTYTLNVAKRIGVQDGSATRVVLGETVPGHTRVNRFTLTRKQGRAGYFSHVVVTDGAESPTTVAGARWAVTAAVFAAGSTTLTLDGDPVWEDGAAVGLVWGDGAAYFPVTASTAPRTIVVTGDARGLATGRFAEVGGVDLVAVPVPGGGGGERRVRRTTLSSASPHGNLLAEAGASADFSTWAGGAPAGWEAFGGAAVMATTAPADVRTGTSSARVTAVRGAGLRSLPINRRDARNVSAWVSAMVANQGDSIRLEIEDAAGRRHPTVERFESTSRTLAALAVGGVTVDTATFRIVVTAASTTATFVLDAATATGSAAFVPYAVNMGPRALWKEAARIIALDGGLLPPALDGDLYELAAIMGGYDEIRLGDAVRVVEGGPPGIDFDVVARVVEVTDTYQVGDASVFRHVRLSDKRADLRGRFAAADGSGTVPVVDGVRVPTPAAQYSVGYRYVAGSGVVINLSWTGNDDTKSVTWTLAAPGAGVTYTATIDAATGNTDLNANDPWPPGTAFTLDAVAHSATNGGGEAEKPPFHMASEVPMLSGAVGEGYVPSGSSVTLFGVAGETEVLGNPTQDLAASPVFTVGLPNNVRVGTSLGLVGGPYMTASGPARLDVRDATGTGYADVVARAFVIYEGGTSFTRLEGEVVRVSDNLIRLNSDATGPAAWGGVFVYRGAATPGAGVVWNETTDRWGAAGVTYTNDVEGIDTASFVPFALNDGALQSNLNAERVAGLGANDIARRGVLSAVALGEPSSLAAGVYSTGGGVALGLPPGTGPGTGWAHVWHAQHMQNNGWAGQIAMPFGDDGLLYRRHNGAAWLSWRRIWTSDRMGAGSTLDADLLDGLHADAFVKVADLANMRAGRVAIHDTRSVAETPEAVAPDLSAVFAFKQRSVMAAPGVQTFGTVASFRQWADASGSPIPQLWLAADGIAYRAGTQPTLSQQAQGATGTWGAWVRLMDESGTYAPTGVWTFSNPSNPVTIRRGTIATVSEVLALDVTGNTANGRGSAITMTRPAGAGTSVPVVRLVGVGEARDGMNYRATFGVELWDATLATPAYVRRASFSLSGLDVQGFVKASGLLDVTGAATLRAGLAVTGAASVTGDATVSGTLGVTGAASVGGAVTLGTQATGTGHAVRADRTFTLGIGSSLARTGVAAQNLTGDVGWSLDTVQDIRTTAIPTFNRVLLTSSSWAYIAQGSGQHQAPTDAAGAWWRGTGITTAGGGAWIGGLFAFGDGATIHRLSLLAGSPNTAGNAKGVHVTPTGNVGVGIVTPGHALHVVGTGYFVGDISASALQLAGLLTPHTWARHVSGVIGWEMFEDTPVDGLVLAGHDGGALVVDAQGSGTPDFVLPIVRWRMDGVDVFRPVYLHERGGQAKPAIASSSFASGFGGHGMYVGLVEYDAANALSHWAATFDTLTVRGTFSVYELLVRQVRATNGSLMVANGFKVVDVQDNGVRPDGKHQYHVWSDEVLPVVPGDYIIAQRLKPDGTGVYQTRLYVEDIEATTRKFIRVVTMPGSDAPGIGMELVRYDNANNPARRGYVFATADDDNAPFIAVRVSDGSGAWPQPAGEVVRLGRLDGRVVDGVALTGMGLVTNRAWLTQDVTIGGNGQYVRVDATGIVFTGVGDRLITSLNSALTLLSASRVAIGAGNLGDAWAGLSAQVGTLNARVVLGVNAAGNVATVQLESGAFGSAIALKADQLSFTGSSTFAAGAVGAINAGTTNITGDRIRTGSITSNNWDATARTGSSFNLVDGSLYVGGGRVQLLTQPGLTRLLLSHNAAKTGWADVPGFYVGADATVTAMDVYGDANNYIRFNTSASYGIRIATSALVLRATAESLIALGATNAMAGAGVWMERYSNGATYVRIGDPNAAWMRWTGAALEVGTTTDPGSVVLRAGSGAVMFAGWTATPSLLHAPTGPGGMAAGRGIYGSSTTGTSGLFYAGRPLMGWGMSWHNSGNAGWVVLGQMAADASTVRAGYYGIQMMRHTGEEVFALGGNAVDGGGIYARIAGFGFDGGAIYTVAPPAGAGFVLHRDGYMNVGAGRAMFGNLAGAVGILMSATGTKASNTDTVPGFAYLVNPTTGAWGWQVYGDANNNLELTTAGLAMRTTALALLAGVVAVTGDPTGLVIRSGTGTVGSGLVPFYLNAPTTGDTIMALGALLYFTTADNGTVRFGASGAAHMTFRDNELTWRNGSVVRGRMTGDTWTLGANNAPRVHLEPTVVAMLDAAGAAVMQVNADGSGHFARGQFAVAANGSVTLGAGASLAVSGVVVASLVNSPTIVIGQAQGAIGYLQPGGWLGPGPVGELRVSFVGASHRFTWADGLLGVRGNVSIVGGSLGVGTAAGDAVVVTADAFNVQAGVVVGTSDDGTWRGLRVVNDAGLAEYVEMFADDTTGAWGLRANSYTDRIFELGSTNQIAGWGFWKTRLSRTNASTLTALVSSESFGASSFSGLLVQRSVSGIWEDRVRVGDFTMPADLVPYTPTNATASIPNVGFEVDTGNPLNEVAQGWTRSTSNGQGCANFDRVTDVKRSGGVSLRITTGAAGAGTPTAPASVSSTFTNVAALRGKHVRLRCYIRSTGGSGMTFGPSTSPVHIAFRIAGQVGAGAWFTVASRRLDDMYLQHETWTEFVVDAVVPSNVDALGLDIVCTRWFAGGTTPTLYLWVDDLSLDVFDRSRTYVNSEGMWTYASPLAQFKLTTTSTTFAAATVEATGFRLLESGAAATPPGGQATVFKRGKELWVKWADGAENKIQIV